MGTSYILKKLIAARDVTQASRLLKEKYPRSKIVTYSMEYKYTGVPQGDRNYSNRHMWVWFVKDVDVLKEELR